MLAIQDPCKMGVKTMLKSFPLKKRKKQNMEVKESLSKILPVRVNTAYSTRLLSINKVLKAEAKEVLYKAGLDLANTEFEGLKAEGISNALSLVADEYFRKGLGRLIMDGVNEKFLLVRNYECATCAAADNDGKTHCWLDAGFIAGALKQMLNEDYVVIETKCCGTGSEYCEFMIAKRHRKAPK